MIKPPQQAVTASPYFLGPAYPMDFEGRPSGTHPFGQLRSFEKLPYSSQRLRTQFRNRNRLTSTLMHFGHDDVVFVYAFGLH